MSHWSTHLEGGPDEILGEMSATARSAISKGGVLIGTRRGLNLIEGPGILLTMADNAGTESVDVEIEYDPSLLVPAWVTGDIKESLATASHGNWLKLDGSSFSGATWPNLQTFLGGTTLPDFRGRSPIGAGIASGGTTNRVLKTTYGSDLVTLLASQNGQHSHIDDHAHDMAQHQHVMSHAHTITDPGHVHETNGNFVVDGATGYAIPFGGNEGTAVFTDSHDTGITINDVGATFKTSQAGAGGTSNTTNTKDATGSQSDSTGNSPVSATSAHENTHPVYTVNFFIYAA